VGNLKKNHLKSKEVTTITTASEKRNSEIQEVNNNNNYFDCSITRNKKVSSYQKFPHATQQEKGKITTKKYEDKSTSVSLNF
jgi:LytS/YehU family sensor histidine kinase